MNERIQCGKELLVEALLYALGRSGATDGLGLKELGIPVGKYGHVEKVDPITYQTAVPNVYAAGDVIGPPALASTSMEQGRMAACHAFEIPMPPAPEHFHYGIYAVPEISTVGMSEQEVQQRGIHYEVGVARYKTRTDRRAMPIVA